MSIKALKLKIISITAAIIFCGLLSETSRAQDYLSAGEIAVISAASVGITVFGHKVKVSAKNNNSLIKGPILFDAQLQKFLGGECREGKTNFLDNTFGSAFTGGLYGTMLFAADMSWPQTDDKGKFVAQDMFLYGSGLLATKGITSLAKGLVARERPLLCLEPEIAGLRNNVDHSYDRNAFFSGHSSSAFFAAVYLNKRLRSIMRHELSNDKYDSWKWAPPTILFTWSSVVGWSRIHAYKHFFTDVVAGALVGFAVAELLYSFNDFDINAASGSGSPSPPSRQIFQVRFTF